MRHQIALQCYFYPHLTLIQYVRGIQCYFMACTASLLCTTRPVLQQSWVRAVAFSAWACLFTGIHVLHSHFHNSRREVLSIHIGQAGVQVANACWEVCASVRLQTWPGTRNLTPRLSLSLGPCAVHHEAWPASHYMTPVLCITSLFTLTAVLLGARHSA